MNQLKLSPAFAAALCAVQGNIEGAVKGSMNPAFRSKYADLGAVWDACREALQNQGIAVLQFPSEAPAGHIGLETVLVYGPTGETLSKTATIPFKDPTNPQAAGSAYTYLRRYALSAVIGICPEDDDGQKASKEVKAVPKKPSIDLLTTWQNFEGLVDIEGMKEFYNRVRVQDIEEPHKTKLLQKMAAVITEKKNQTVEGMKKNG